MTTIVDASYADYVEALRRCPETWSGIRNRALCEAGGCKWRESRVFMQDKKDFNISVAECLLGKIAAPADCQPSIEEIIDAAVAVAIAEFPPIIRFREDEIAQVISFMQAERSDLWVGLTEKAVRRYNDNFELDKHDDNFEEYIRELSIVRNHSDPERACRALVAALREVAWN